jgi:hypothetical protein
MESPTTFRIFVPSLALISRKRHCTIFTTPHFTFSSNQYQAQQSWSDNDGLSHTGRLLLTRYRVIATTDLHDSYHNTGLR